MQATAERKGIFWHVRPEFSALSEKSVHTKTRHFSSLIREAVRVLVINIPNALIVGGCLTNNLDMAQIGWLVTLPRVMLVLHRKDHF